MTNVSIPVANMLKKKLNTCCICCNIYFHAIVFRFCTRPQGTLLCGWASYNVGFEVFTAVTMKNAVFWDVEPCGSCENRRFQGSVASILSTEPTNPTTPHSLPTSPFSATVLIYLVFYWVQSARQLLILSLVLRFFYPEDGGNTFLRNVCSHKTHTVPRLRRRCSSEYIRRRCSSEYIIFNFSKRYSGAIGYDAIFGNSDIKLKMWEFILPGRGVQY
jgi:hypothetical protein